MPVYALAIDIGASSGRHILGHMENGEIIMEEIYRFPNGMHLQNGHQCWDIEGLEHHVLEGLKEAGRLGKAPATIAIDTWGVDYVLLDGENRRIGDVVAYRDERTLPFVDKLAQVMPHSAQYARAGIAYQPFNTVYQLMAEMAEHPGRMDEVKQVSLMPCYLSGMLCGVYRNEYTMASTTGMLDAVTRDWNADILSAAGIPAEKLGGKPAAPGTVLGDLLPEVQQQVGYNAKVMLCACHDTGSAFHAVPAKDDHAVYISSGTWSLLGAVLPEPVVSEEARLSGFTNEGGVKGIRFLQNIMGLWMLQCIRHEWDDRLSFAEMAELAATGSAYPHTVDATDNRFMNPESMVGEIRQALRDAGCPDPASDAELLYCVNHSLAAAYGRAIANLARVTGREYTSINIVGGGCRNRLLNRLTAEASGLPVTAGPAEGTALGNLMVQLGL